MDTNQVNIPIVTSESGDLIEAGQLVSVYEEIESLIVVPENLSFNYFDLSDAFLDNGNLTINCFTVSAASSAWTIAEGPGPEWSIADERRIDDRNTCVGSPRDRNGMELFNLRVNVKKEEDYYDQYYNPTDVLYWRNNITYRYNIIQQSGFMPLNSDHLPGQPNEVITHFSQPITNSSECMYLADYLDQEDATISEILSHKPAGAIFDWHNLYIDREYFYDYTSNWGWRRYWYTGISYGIPVLQ